MKRHYETPEIEIQEFVVEDICTTSAPYEEGNI
ncbi:hypothetical protein Ethha_0863 [Ethanoligenens harbinense YUAN-3]|uniref:Uncharacterized protein n=1 Tax=Ethanoligenens harbinense (strain DSM 18485 / JCM 12961 / CGMCC 1.5033 / YUAN-3) TaxID=663278 RepID=E6U3D8_ETHHY|nr:hypothetical protein Ethha_0863 [Ethanoligenens harbinense YUAN-3]